MYILSSDTLVWNGVHGFCWERGLGFFRESVGRQNVARCGVFKGKGDWGGVISVVLKGGCGLTCRVAVYGPGSAWWKLGTER